MATATTRRTAPLQQEQPDLAAVLSEVRALAVKVDRVLALLERQHRPRLTTRDQRLLEAIIARIGYGVMFTAGELLRHAGVDGELQRALDACDLSADTNMLGRRLKKIARADARLVRWGRDDRGTVYFLRPDDT